ncbi:MAG: hypothetical protein IJ705_00445 [Oscillospiraceae bacterium]|nr:hypothetical protein [Oscillospiraceae bacterium]
MKRRVLALSLALAALLALLTGCGSAEQAKSSGGKEAPSLSPGYYAVYADASGRDRIGYLRASYSRLRVNNSQGEQLQSLLYSIDDDGTVYAEGTALYTLSEKRGEIHLSAADGTVYTLGYLGAELLAEGSYAVYAAETNERLGFLHVENGELSFYDTSEQELARYAFRVSDEGEISSEGKTLYHANYGWGGLHLTNEDGRDYLLVPSDFKPKN